MSESAAISEAYNKVTFDTISRSSPFGKASEGPGPSALRAERGNPSPTLSDLDCFVAYCSSCWAKVSFIRATFSGVIGPSRPRISGGKCPTGSPLVWNT